ncbi:Kunitz/Bovine pancreatic trypsin inhibitor domain protein [Oesophagostomum dentatum]|uniref:Kunitz/Bovine pancreatic trypsin inhibitor domain protein n=1 Tax=Oesophagostomum dentatum TaxID=61180 RepID=A0A0B1SYD3_OESDE|nr:Kunitz/Bovine pancreatic trypsin inhibitor domain protein [Oesophagostomum dentatum]
MFALSSESSFVQEAMLPRWLLLALVVTLTAAAAEDNAFLSAMKNLFFGSEQYNATATVDLTMHPSPAASNHQTFRQISVDPCTQDQESGVGSAQLTRFYFNKNTKLCEELVYFGAGGNRNNFLTLEECQSQCPGCELCTQPALLSTSLFGWCREFKQGRNVVHQKVVQIIFDKEVQARYGTNIP